MTAAPAVRVDRHDGLRTDDRGEAAGPGDDSGGGIFPWLLLVLLGVAALAVATYVCVQH